jgi:hypothetical protein
VKGVFPQGPHWGTWKEAHLPRTLSDGWDGAPLGELGRGGPSTGNFGNLLKEGSGYAASLTMGALLGEPGRGAHLLVALKVMKGRLWGWASLFMGHLEWAHLPGTLKYGWKGLWRWSVSLWELCEGNLEGGLRCWEP